MNKLHSLFENSELIAKKKTGKLNEEETNRFNQWLNESEQNRIFFKRIQDNRNFFFRNEQFESIDTRLSWNKVARNLVADRKKRNLSVFLKYAAVILFSLLIGTAVYWARYERAGFDRTQVSEISPGTKSAFLVLSDGQKIDLGKERVGALKEADGTLIEKRNDALSYANQQNQISKEVLLDELVVPRGGEYSLILSDGTKVFLNSMSTLSFPVRFSGEKREISLQGEAYFEVQRDENRPFIVKANGMQIRVLGTSFNVKAYQDERNIYTTLVEGSVRINSGGQTGKEYELRPDQQAVFDRINEMVTVQNVDAGEYIQWTTGRYVFSDQSLDEIMKTLCRWYDFTYRYSDESLKELRFEGGLNKYESIVPVLDIITRTGKLNVSVKGKEVLFSKK